MRILLTGATGLIGSRLGIELVKLGHEITALTRRGKPLELCFPARVLAWDHLTPLQKSVLCPANEMFDAVIHLAGEPVAQRWTNSTKQKIYDSRIKSTRALFATFKGIGAFPKIWLNASAIGVYGDSSESLIDEGAPIGQGFLADVCKDWEHVLADLPETTRSGSLRFGVVLSNEGGALPQMLTPFIYGLGGPIGDGRQSFSWIHIDDVIAAITHTLTQPSLKGPINIVGPNPCTNNDLTLALAKITKMPAFFRVPKFILRLLLGQMSTIVTSGTRVAPKKLLDVNFTFKYPTLRDALRHLLAHCQPRGTRLFVARQWVPGSPESQFPFFSAAENLETITPPWLNFKIINKSTPTIKEGTLINYKLKIKGLPVRWRTRIENWNPPHQFVDTQLIGPYRTWHHTHTFETLADGTLMTDQVLYRMYVWPLGDLALPMVRQDVRKIFNYRRVIIEKLLATKNQPR